MFVICLPSFKTSLSQYKHSSMDVARRYSDFVALHTQLLKDLSYLPPIFLPELPSDTWASLMWKQCAFGVQNIAFFAKC